MKTPFTAKSLKHHLTYSWWIYILIALAAFGLVDLLYSVTAYRSPRDKVVGLYVYGYANEDELNAYLESVRVAEMPDMEVLSTQTLLNDAEYGPMLIMTYMAAGEGDLYLLPRDQFLSYASGGSLIPLEIDEYLVAIFDSAGISLQSGWRRNTETGETHLYGIPQDKLPGLGRYAYAQDGFLCLVASSANQENAVKLLNILCRDLITASSEP